MDPRPALERALGEPIIELELIAQSSNLVYRVATRSGKLYSLRVPHLERLSAFWCQLRDIFGHGYASKFDHAGEVGASIRAAGLDAPSLVTTVDLGSTTGYLFTWIDGESWEPDPFPDRDDVHEQLGRFLGAMHGRSFDGFGPRGELIPKERYVATANASMSAIIEEHWRHTPAINRFFEDEIAPCLPDAVARDFALIMPDISGNQFVYGEDGIAGVVDIDSYVIGPRELELTIAEWCITRPEAFRRGYEEHAQLPRFADFRRYHRFMMLVNDPNEDVNLEHALTISVHFT